MKMIKILGLVVLFALTFGIVTAANLSVTADNEEEPYTVIENALKVGRYYQDGDTSKSYVEVFSNGTLQWCNLDFESQVRNSQKARNANTADYEEAIQTETERLSSVHEYTVVKFNGVNMTMIAWDWVEESGAAQGFIYIDENTFKFTDSEVFIYVE